MHRKFILLSHRLTMRETDVASLVEFCSVVKEEIAGWMDGWGHSQYPHCFLSHLLAWCYIGVTFSLRSPVLQQFH